MCEPPPSPRVSLSRTLFDQSHLARKTLLPQAVAVVPLIALDGGVLRGDETFVPRNLVHLPLLEGGGALPLLALRRCGGEDGTDKSGEMESTPPELCESVLIC